MTRRLSILGVALLALLVLFRALSQPPRIRGDGLEYIVQTQAIVFDRALSIDTTARDGYWNESNPFAQPLGPVQRAGELKGEESQAHGGFGGLYPDRQGGYHYIHFWLYSLLCAPLYLLLHLLFGRPVEYNAFLVMNAMFFALPFLVLAARQRGIEALIAFAAFTFSPLTGYVWWYSPELMCFSFALLSLLLSDHPRWSAATPVLLAAAVTHYPPGVAMFPLLWLLRARSASATSRSWIAGNIIAALLIVLSLFCYWRWFGTFNLVHTLGFASRENLSIGRAVDFFINPFTGSLWMFAVPLAYGVARGCWRTSLFWIALACSLATAYLCTSTNNVNSAAFGCARYATWFWAPLFYAILIAPHSISRSLRRAVLLTIALSSILLTFRAHAALLGNPDIFEHRLRPEVAALIRFTHYPGTPETFAEKISSKDFAAAVQFSGVYVWNISKDSSMWLVSKRALRSFRNVTVPSESECTSKLPAPFQCNGTTVTLNLAAIDHWSKEPSLGGYRYFRVGSRMVPGMTPGVVVR